MNYQNELYHFGIKGQKWGIRRYQNPDGTLTEAGKKRLAKQIASDRKYSGMYEPDRATELKALSKRLSKEDDKLREASRNAWNREYELREKGYRDKDLEKDKKLSKLRKVEYEALNMHKAKAYKIVDEYLGEYGNFQLKNSNLTNEKAVRDRAANFIRTYAAWHYGR